jgi:hypothetical protein
VVPEEREVGREGHPAIAQLLICVSNYRRRSDRSEDIVVKHKLNRTEATGIRPNERDLENLELQDTLDAVSQVFPSAEVVSKLPQIQEKILREVTRIIPSVLPTFPNQRTSSD